MSGFGVVAALPGPLFNLSVYLGGVIDGVKGAILSWLSLFIPAFLLIWGILPYWNKYRKKPKIKRVLKGIGSVSVGFIFAAAVLLLL